jgi:general secretion pathway protein E
MESHMLFLEYTTPQGPKRVKVGTAPITIGRHMGNLVSIPDDDLASRYHAIIERKGEELRVQDLGSRNGTRVNGKVVGEWVVRAGDVIVVGRTSMTLLEADAAAPKTPAPAAAPAAGGKSTQQTTTAGPQSAKPTQGSGMPERFVPPAEAGAGATPARVLSKLADSLPVKPFEQTEIVLIDCKGRVAHDVYREGHSDLPSEAVTILRLILLVCSRTRASDIHIEPRVDEFMVRVRIDGVMVEVCRLSRETATRLLSLIKVLCEIDLTGKNIIQEGNFSTRLPDRRVDYRVSLSPSVHGQKLVIRVLDSANSPRYLWELNLPDPMFRELEKSMRRDTGMVLVSGPTGSGKTATLYAVLRTIDATERNVVTIEDPVEIQLENVTQMPVDNDAGSSFPNLLRSVLRQDPDVILVGEIRDQETAKVSMQAAMTGHLVFSTVHSRDTVGSVFRLLDLGVEPFMVSSALQNIIAQRLVRVLCPFCKYKYAPTNEQLTEMGPEFADLDALYRENGCARCLGTGFAGRRGIFELLAVNDDLREAVQKQNQAEISQAAKRCLMKTLKQSGMELVGQGITTLEEVDRVVGA